MLNLQDLHTFQTVAREGGITRAAEKLCRVQSSVTARIQKLEAEMGQDLFIREGKQMHISQAGRHLLGYADKLIALATEAETALQGGTPRGELRIGAMDSTAAVRLPGPLAAFHARFPDASIRLTSGNPITLAAQVRDGSLDAALIAGDIAEDIFDSLDIYTEHLVLVSRPGDDADTPRNVIVFENGCPHRKRLEQVFQSMGTAPASIIEIASYHAMFASVLAGMGTALMPESTYLSLPDHQRARATALPAGMNTLVTRMIWRKGAATPLIDAFRSVLPEPEDPCSPSPLPSSS